MMTTQAGSDGRCVKCGAVVLTSAGCTACPVSTASTGASIRYVYEMPEGSDERVRATLAALTSEFESAIRHHDNRWKGGQQVTFTGDFASVGPGTLQRMRWWLREMKAALGEGSEP